MKRHDSLGKSLHKSRRLLLASAPVFGRSFGLLLLVLPLAFTSAAELKEARVSQVIKDVKLLPTQAAPRPAAVSDQVRNGTAVRTGIESRAELTFTDQTLARLGANTIFSFNQGTRNLDLSGGAMLLRVPKNAGGAQINTAAVTAAITGTTIMLEYHPNAYIKFIVLEGTGRIFRKDHVGESVLVHAGQMLIVNPKAKNLPDPVDVDLKRLMQTSQLITDFGGLASSDLIAHEIQTQLDQKSKGGLVDTNLVIFGGGTAVTLAAATEAVDQRSAVTQTTGSGPSVSPTPPPTATPTPTATADPNAHCHRNSDTHCDCNPHTHRHGYSYPDGNSHAHTNTHSNSDSHADNYSHAHTDHYSDPDSNTHNYANPNPDAHDHSHSHTNPDDHAHSHAHANNYPNPHADPDYYPYADADCDTYAGDQGHL